MSRKIGFIGAGVMGKAIIKGLISSGFSDKENIFASEVSREAADKVATELGIKVFTDNNDLVKNCDVVVIATKPYILKKVLEQVKGSFDGSKLVVSIAAAIATSLIEEVFDFNIPVIRVMPNTPVLVGEGMTAVSKGRYTSQDDVEFACELFSSVGRCVEVEEKLINAVTGISGSGPAFFYSIIESMADGGLKLGLSKKVAIELAAQTALGAAKMVLKTGKHPAVLKDEVTTPGGTTIAGLMVMEEMGVSFALAKTVQETARKADELGK